MSVEDSLALKYRPKKLSEVIGQPRIVKAFTNAFKSGTLHHAYILSGNTGCGKTTVARIVAATENCKKGGKDPCGECSNCVAIFEGKSLEVNEIDAGSKGKVDDIRELHKSLYQYPVECNTKYVIIDEAHSLTGQAAEASLKMIEEPPKFVRFILCIDGDQILYCQNNKHVKIKDIKEGETILTEDGFSKIKNKFYKGTSTVYALRTTGGSILRLTDSHRVRVFDGNSIVWKEASKITDKDYLPIFHSHYDKNNENNKNKLCDLTSDECEFLGRVDDIYLQYLKKSCCFERFHSLTPVGESDVYDLEMDNVSHSFIVNGFSVHNCTTEPQAFKPTIHNRCIMWSVSKVSWPDLFSHLKMISEKEGIDVDDSALQVAAKNAKGSVRNALQNLQTMMNYVGDGKITAEEAREALGAIDESLYYDLVYAIHEKDTVKAFLAINKLFMDGKEARFIVNGLYEHINNLLIERTCRSNIEQFDFTQEEIKKLAHQNSKTLGRILLKMMSLVSSISFDIEYSLNPAHSFNKFAVESIEVVKAAKLKI